MVEQRYNPDNPELSVPQQVMPIFQQLFQALGKEFEIWVRTKNFDREVCAAVLNPSSDFGDAILTVQKGGGLTRQAINANEIIRIRDHLQSNAAEDLQL